MKNTSKPKNGKNRTEKRRELDLLLMLKAVLKKLWLIILIAVLVGGMTFIGLKLFVAPTYRSSFTAFVNNTQEKRQTEARTSSDVMASQALANAYSKIITSRSVLGEAAKDMGMTNSYGSLKSMVSTSISDQTGIITVDVDTKDKAMSHDFAEAIEKRALEYTAAVIEGSSMKIIDHPFYPEGIYKPNYTKYTMLSAIIAAMLTVIVICVMQFFNDKVHSESDLADHYAIPIVGVVPDIISAGSDSGNNYYYYKYGHSHRDAYEAEKSE